MKKSTARDDTSSSSAAAPRNAGTPHSHPQLRGCCGTSANMRRQSYAPKFSKQSSQSQEAKKCSSLQEYQERYGESTALGHFWKVARAASCTPELGRTCWEMIGKAITNFRSHGAQTNQRHAKQSCNHAPRWPSRRSHPRADQEARTEADEEVRKQALKNEKLKEMRRRRRRTGEGPGLE